jgi:transcriptional regulator with XRE-family HTH domain
MKLSRRLVAARKRAGLSQAELAKKLKVSAGTVAGWETEGDHAHGMRVSRVRQVAKVLGIDVTELLA